MTVDRTAVCQNDRVNMTCQSGPTNPAASSYKFYHNGALVQNSSSNAYSSIATYALPNLNRFICIPSNILGDALQNSTIDVKAKGKGCQLESDN